MHLALIRLKVVLDFSKFLLFAAVKALSVLLQLYLIHERKACSVFC